SSSSSANSTRFVGVMVRTLNSTGWAKTDASGRGSLRLRVDPPRALRGSSAGRGRAEEVGPDGAAVRGEPTTGPRRGRRNGEAQVLRAAIPSGEAPAAHAVDAHAEAFVR